MWNHTNVRIKKKEAYGIRTRSSTTSQGSRSWPGRKKTPPERMAPGQTACTCFARTAPPPREPAPAPSRKNRRACTREGDVARNIQSHEQRDTHSKTMRFHFFLKTPRETRRSIPHSHADNTDVNKHTPHTCRQALLLLHFTVDDSLRKIPHGIPCLSNPSNET